MTILPYGNNALLVNFDQEISAEILKKVKLLEAHLQENEAVVSLIPAYCSLTVVFDTNKTSFDLLSATIKNFRFSQAHKLSNIKKIRLPVCYDVSFGWDLNDLSEALALSPPALIDLHSKKIYDTYMIGFLPGFPYLGKTVEKLYCQRKAVPRKQVACGSVALAGSQTGIYPMQAPGGWQIIGRTPIPIFQPANEDPFLIKPGDQVQFNAISKKEFESIEAAIIERSFQWEEIYE